MIKKGIMILLVMGIQGCVGTAKFAQNSPNEQRSLETSSVSKNETETVEKETKD